VTFSVSHRPRRAAVIALANPVGRCARTTGAAPRGAAFVGASRRTLLVDADPQANLSERLGVHTTDLGPGLEHPLAADFVVVHGRPADLNTEVAGT